MRAGEAREGKGGEEGKLCVAVAARDKQTGCRQVLPVLSADDVTATSRPSMIGVILYLSFPLLFSF